MKMTRSKNDYRARNDELDVQHPAFFDTFMKLSLFLDDDHSKKRSKVLQCLSIFSELFSSFPIR